MLYTYSCGRSKWLITTMYYLKKVFLGVGCIFLFQAVPVLAVNSTSIVPISTSPSIVYGVVLAEGTYSAYLSPSDQRSYTTSGRCPTGSNPQARVSLQQTAYVSDDNTKMIRLAYTFNNYVINVVEAYMYTGSGYKPVDFNWIIYCTPG